MIIQSVVQSVGEHNPLTVLDIGNDFDVEHLHRVQTIITIESANCEERALRGIKDAHVVSATHIERRPIEPFIGGHIEDEGVDVIYRKKR